MTKNKNESNSGSAILLINCPDKIGLVASVTEFISKNNGNIINLDEHVDIKERTFFMRIEWDLSNFVIPSEKIGDYFQTLISKKFNMQWKLYFSDEIPRLAIYVSKLSHCLYDILARSQSREWRIEIPLIISNHSKLQSIAEIFDINYHVFPINSKNKHEQEQKQLELLKKHKIDFIVLARYMQILTDDFVNNYKNKIINIHHSFLPAFPGAKPYESAFERGVKIIGATSHYVTADLDEGPIIDQDVTGVSHADSVKDLIRKGRDLDFR